MQSELRDPSSTGAGLVVLLDEQPVAIPAARRSLPSIRAYLEILALEKQRILCSLKIDGARINLAAMLPTPRDFRCVEAKTIDLAEVPLQLVATAMTQAGDARAKVLSAVTLVLINDNLWAREHWWHLARILHQPVLTLSLMPETACGAEPAGASLIQLRRWQLQQLAEILKDVDQATLSDDPAALSNALEYRVLPWLHGLETSLELWRDTLQMKPLTPA